MNGFYGGSHGFRRRRHGGETDGPVQSRLDFDLGARLASFKSSPLVQMSDISALRGGRTERMFMSGACSKCTPRSANSTFSQQEPSIITQHGLANVLRTNFTPIDPLQRVEKKLDIQLTVKALKDQIEKRSGLISILDESASETVPPTTAELLTTFSRLRVDLEPAVDNYTFFTRLWQKVTTWLLSLLYPNGIVYHPGQLEVIAKAMVCEHPMVFVPVSCSGMDPVIINLVLKQLDIRPIMANTEGRTKESAFDRSGGGSLNVLPWQEVDESREHSHYNWSVQSLTVQRLLKGGHDFLLFLNGHTKSSAKECNKRKDLLFLQLLVDELVSMGEVEDIWVVPVMVTHEATVEERFGSDRITIWTAIKLLCRKIFTPSDSICSMARVDFEQPFRMSEMIASLDNKGPNDQFDMVPLHVDNLVSHILWATSRSKRYSSKELISFLKMFPTLFSRGDSTDTADRLNHLRDELQHRKFDTIFSGTSADIVKSAESTICRTIPAVSIARTVIPVFIFEAVTAMSICSLLQIGSLNCYVDSNAALAISDYDHLIETAVLLTSLLECHYTMRPPCGDLQTNIQAAIDWFKVHEVIREDESKGDTRGQHLQDRRSHRLATLIEMNLDDEADDEKMFRQQARKLFVNTSKQSLEQLYGWRDMILSDVKSIYLAIVALVSIVDVDFVAVKELVNQVVKAADGDQGLMRVSESLSRLEQMLVIDSGYTEYKGCPDTKVIWLTEEYNNLERLSKLAGRILPFIS